MKLIAAGIVLLLLGSVGAEAGIFGKTDKLPKPIDSPVVRPKTKEQHKVGKRVGRHPKAFLRPEWGAVWHQTMDRKRHHPIPPYLYQTR